MATKDDIIKNFSSLRSSNICFMRLGLKLKIKKKMMRYHPQNFAKKIELSMVQMLFVQYQKRHVGMVANFFYSWQEQNSLKIV